MAFWNKKKDDGFDFGMAGQQKNSNNDIGLPPLDFPEAMPTEQKPSPFGAEPPGFSNQGMMQHNAPESFPQQNSFNASGPMQPSPSQNPAFENMQRNIEILVAKVDSIKAQLEVVNQRIIKIERIADEEKNSQQTKVW
ncbi:MAG: hypothetical protein V1659_05410 [Candidatus Woesearchaeota archaeon]